MRAHTANQRHRNNHHSVLDGGLLAAGADLGRCAVRAGSDAMHTIGDQVRDRTREAIRAGNRARKSVERGISRRPLQSVGIAFGAGALAAILFSALRRG